MLIVACAVGTAPVDTGEGEGSDGGPTSAVDGNYGTTGDSGPVSGNDSGVVKADAGTKEGGTTPIDSGTPITTTGLDCVGKTSTSGEKFESECQDLSDDGEESDCSIGGGECGTGTCCWDNSGSFSLGSCDGIFGDFLSAQCVPQ
jgi:hypothetical protein